MLHVTLGIEVFLFRDMPFYFKHIGIYSIGYENLCWLTSAYQDGFCYTDTRFCAAHYLRK